MMRQKFFCCILLILNIAMPLTIYAQEAVLPEPDIDLERIQRATVFIMQVLDSSTTAAPEITCVGTGTLISRDGLILTNAHNTTQSALCPGNTLLIALSVRQDDPPVTKYRADIVQVDPGLDLALLRIRREIDGREVDPESLFLPFAVLGDSQTVRLDDTITVVGYRGISDEPIANVRGTITGFSAEPIGGEKSWMKTSAPIPGTMTGGGAYNQRGELIGIPTTAPVPNERGQIACIWDTNNDGLVNNADRCVALGESINALRPSNFARRLLRAAALGLSVQSLTETERRPVASGDPRFSRLFFSPSVNDAGMPTTVLRSLPAGSNSLYLFFDFQNMTPETVYALRVTADGILNQTFSLAPVRWSGGERGMWYLGSRDQPYPNGVYEFTLFANGVAADTARIVIGGGAEPAPTFSDITFGLIDLQGNILGNGFVLPTGSIANARFLFRNMTDGLPWTAVWYYNGIEISRTPPDNVWQDGASGAKTINIQAEGGLLPGNYRLELFIEGRLAATSDFTIAGAQQGANPQIFTDSHFTSAATPAEARTSAAVNTFSAGVPSIYSVFDWQQIAPGTPWTMRWSVDNGVFYEQTIPWSADDSGDNYLVQLSAPGGIPDGTYQMELYVGKVLTARIQARVGIGQLPIDRFSLTTGAQMRGRILDADTGQGIPGATFVLISADFSVDDFTWSEEQIYAMSVTDRNGNFEIDRLLEFSTDDRAVPYSALVVAAGYLPLSADGIEITPDDPTPVNMTIYLTRD